MAAMRDYGPRDKNARQISTFNGWLVLCVLVPVMLLMGIDRMFHQQLFSGLLLAAVSMFCACVAWWAIQFGRGLR